MIEVSSSGEWGDVIYLCAVLHAQPHGPHKLYLQRDKENQTSGKVIKHPEIITPLVLAQKYISECRVIKPQEKVQWHSQDFRRTGHHGPTITLVRAHAGHGMHVGAIKKFATGNEGPWLQVPVSLEAAERVLVARTSRWGNPHFNWGAVVRTYGSRVLFLGTPEEHQSFCMDYGRVEYRPTGDLLEAASLIAGCWLYISNQTSLYAIATGLGVRRILAVSLSQTDCCYTVGDVQHVIDGEMRLPLPEGGFEHIESNVSAFSENVSTMAVPPDGGWDFRGIKHTCFNVLRDQVVQEFKLSPDAAYREIIRTSQELHPTFFGTSERQDLRDHLKRTLQESTR